MTQMSTENTVADHTVADHTVTDSTATHTTVDFDTVERAIADIAAGKAVVVVDDEDRENEGDLIFAAEKATPELVAFMVRYLSLIHI